MIGPASGDTLRALPATADRREQWVADVDLIELVPDQAVIVEVEAAGEGDLRTGRQHDFGVSPAPGGEEVAAVDDGGSQGAMVDLRTAARMPVQM